MELLIWVIAIAGAVTSSAFAIAMVYACYDTIMTLSQEYRHKRQLEEIIHWQAVKDLLLNEDEYEDEDEE